MKDQIYDMLIEAADAVAEKHYPKGENGERGQFLVAQALLHVELASRIEKFAEQVERDTQLKTTAKVTRFEVVDLTKNEDGSVDGRTVVKYGVNVELSFQDDDRTLKVFLSDKEK